ncbi:transposase [Pseudoblastomonas halimionae]|uniref:Transposase n=1 Tax=Alteriqipengyuania halimionae TaxID=1926630 RepID=A0A6I4TYG7_9SPHN|nr:transposase [Alteriqipengyuania halimionae]MXP08700.1 transposase [Alteriqipengyuania halimionae]
MPRLITCASDRAIGLNACIDALSARQFDPRDEDSLAHGALCLRELGNDRRFLGDLIARELADRDSPPREQGYGPQSIVLSSPQSGFFLRANIWPAEQDHAVQASGRGAFQYDVPHDHNFSFLTLGYFGPGYRSDYWEYEYEDVVGHIGEHVALEPKGRQQLTPGRIMLYRAHRDIHSQIPPLAMSVSLNVMHADGSHGWFDQYAFDPAAGVITDRLGTGSSEAFIRIAVSLESDAALDLAENFGRSHPSDRMRYACWDARAGIVKDDEARDAVWREAEVAGSRLIAAEARRKRAELAG